MCRACSAEAASGAKSTPASRSPSAAVTRARACSSMPASAAASSLSGSIISVAGRIPSSHSSVAQDSGRGVSDRSVEGSFAADSLLSSPLSPRSCDTSAPSTGTLNAAVASEVNAADAARAYSGSICTASSTRSRLAPSFEESMSSPVSGSNTASADSASSSAGASPRLWPSASRRVAARSAAAA